MLSSLNGAEPACVRHASSLGFSDWRVDARVGTFHRDVGREFVSEKLREASSCHRHYRHVAARVVRRAGDIARHGR